MKVKLLVGRVGPDIVQNAGDVVEVSEAEGKRMLEATPPQCVPVAEERAVERAVKSRKG